VGSARKRPAVIGMETVAVTKTPCSCACRSRAV
jgi:hypothetical protein